jgi:alpha-mannosidase
MPLTRRRLLGGSLAAALTAAQPSRRIWIVPNFHPASCGWLTNFSKERVYCANSYFDHLDRVRDDPHYRFVLSECNNLMAMMNFQPGRMEELRARVREGRVELVNAFFLESTVNLSGGEALVRLGLEGLRWQQQLFGVRPRFGWLIDICGLHEQMAQICAGLGLEAMVYCRKNPTGKLLHWTESPDGSRILTFAPPHYAELRALWKAAGPLNETEAAEVERTFDARVRLTPGGAPALVLAGSGDYSLAPARRENPSAFLREWQAVHPDTEIRFATAGQYLDEILPAVRANRIALPTLRGGTAYDFDSFWIQCPRVKGGFRRAEHALQAAEMLAAAASARRPFPYPSRDLYHAWLMLFLNMDRNTLWGAAGGMVFEHERSWDVRDRFAAIGQTCARVSQAAGEAMLARGSGVGCFNPANWRRSDPVVLRAAPAGIAAEALPGGGVLCQPELPPCGWVGWKKGPVPPPARALPAPPETVENDFYVARLDSRTGALASLRIKPSGRELLGGPANTVVLEKVNSQRGDPGDFTVPRPERTPLGSTGESDMAISAASGPVATTFVIRGRLLASEITRVVRFYHRHPRIDFITEIGDLPDRTVTVAEFPLADEVTEVRRGIPYGFSHGAWAVPRPGLYGWTKGITPAVRWSHYALRGGGGVALLDRGLTGRELNGRTPVVYLFNATERYYGYPSPWLSGKGKHVLEYALVAHGGDWREARIPHLAWEFNCPPVEIAGCAPQAPVSLIETSGNVIVEAVRREQDEIEVRLAECLGEAGPAEVHLQLPYRSAARTDLTGERRTPFSGKLDLRPQQIATLRYRTATTAPAFEPLTRWDELAPEAKRAALHEYSPDKGHPPRGD